MTGSDAATSGSVETLRDSMGARLAAWDRHEVPFDPAQRRAAVAVTVYDRGGRAHVLMIKRVPRGTNAGQWAIPGGRVDPGEDATTAALRELGEETGLVAARTDVLGLLDDFTATSGFVITPVVVALEGVHVPRRSPSEVASLHPIPLSRLTEPGVPRWRTTVDGEPLLQMPLRHDMLVHAPTGAILWQFAEVCLRGRTRRVASLAEPPFTAH